MLKKHRVLLILILSLIVLPTSMLVVLGIVASGTASCHHCLFANEQVLNLSFSELTILPEKYHNQFLRLEAIFNHDAGYTFLRDPLTNDWGKSLPVGFGPDFTACATTQRALSFHTGLGTWYDGATQVTVIGKYGIINDQRNFQTGQTGFTITCLEQVKPDGTIKQRSINTIRYCIGQIGKIVFHKPRNT